VSRVGFPIALLRAHLWQVVGIRFLPDVGHVVRLADGRSMMTVAGWRLRRMESD
jgi:hypothetical protein